MSAPSDVVAQAVKDGAFPGAQLAVSVEGRTVVSESFGALEPGGPAVRPDTSYDLASLTKPLATSVLFARALDRGQLSLEDPLCRFVAGPPPDIRVLDALEHATGWPAHRRFDLELPEHELDVDARWRWIVEAAARTPLEAAPRTRAVYSDLGYIVLGAALEALEGSPISTSFAALGTQLEYRDARPKAPAPGPAPAGGFAPTEHELRGVVHDENARALGGAAGHAGLFGTANGVLELAESLVRAWHGSANELASSESVRRIWAPSQVPGSTRTPGWDRPSPSGSSTGGSWPAHAVGHLGFTGTSLWIEPRQALVAVLLTNRVCPTRDNVAIREVRPRLHEAVWRSFGV